MNYYEILGVGPDATEQQIKVGYRREAMKWHPDRHEGAAAKGEADRRFKDLALAYRTLRDPAARADYDRELEQKLRGEYDARQQEQFRQDRAQKEQAQRKQTKQEQPRQNSSETGSQFEEQTTTGDDANQMFFEQMLDLAFDLAGRGFSEANISKALIALGCPASMAKAVAAIAAKGAQSKGNGPAQADARRNAPSIDNFDTASWEALEPYYAAAVLGSSRHTPISVQRYDAVQAVRKGRGDFWLGLGVVVALLGAVGAKFGTTKASDVFAIVTSVELILVLLAIISRGVFLGPDKSSFFREKVRRYYMDHFRAFYMEKHGDPRVTSFNWSAALFNVSWLGYRRNLGAAFLFVLVYCGAAIALTAVESGAYSGWIALTNVMVSAAIGFYGNRLYFNKVETKIRESIRGTSQDQAIAILRKTGGSNQLGWIIPVLLFFVFSIPIYAIQKEQELEKYRIAQEARAAQVAAAQAEEQAENARRQRIAEQARVHAKAEYDAALRSIEARYPQLNPDSSTYNPAALNWVAERKSSYEKEGRSSTLSLNQAVIDYSLALQQYRQQQSVQPAAAPVSRRQTVPQNSKSDQTSRYQADSVVCKTWPSSCR